jgi:hypothetical protein
MGLICYFRWLHTSRQLFPRFHWGEAATNAASYRFEGMDSMIQLCDMFAVSHIVMIILLVPLSPGYSILLLIMRRRDYSRPRLVSAEGPHRIQHTVLGTAGKQRLFNVRAAR